MKNHYIKQLHYIDNGVISRIELMRQLSAISPIFPSFQFLFENECVIQYVQHIKTYPWPNEKQIMKRLWIEFKQETKKMHEMGYVHGDILRKNILYDGERLRLIDHEMQLTYNNMLRVTFPWVDKNDYLNKQVTINTDHICLKATELRLFDDVCYREFRKEQTEMLYSLTKIKN